MASQEFKSFSTSAAVTSTVDEVSLEFLPCRMETLLRFQPVITAAWKALDVLLKSSDADKGTEQEILTGPDGSSSTKVNQSALTPEAIKARTALRNNAIESLSGAIASPDATKAMGAMILDSLRSCPTARDAFKAAKLDTSDPSKFFNGLVPSMVVGLISGMWAANKGAFGPLAEKAVQAAAGAAGRLKEKVDNLQMTPTEGQTSTDSFDNSKTT